MILGWRSARSTWERRLLRLRKPVEHTGACTQLLLHPALETSPAVLAPLGKLGISSTTRRQRSRSQRACAHYTTQPGHCEAGAASLAVSGQGPPSTPNMTRMKQWPWKPKAW